MSKFKGANSELQGKFVVSSAGAEDNQDSNGQILIRAGLIDQANLLPDLAQLQTGRCVNQ